MSTAKLSPSTMGTTAELTVSADLLRRGFSVYRALSPNAKVDLIAVIGDRCYQVEVKSRKQESLRGIKGDVLAYPDGDGVKYVALRGALPVPLREPEPETQIDWEWAYKEAVRRDSIWNLLTDGIAADWRKEGGTN